MSKQKDELITASELARRLGVNPSYIAKQKKKLIEAKCTFGKKFYYNKCCDFLGKNPKDPHQSRQSELQKEVSETKKNEPESTENWTVVKGKKNINKKIDEIFDEEEPEQEDEDEQIEDDAKSLLEQILKAVKSGSSSDNRRKLDTLRQKAGVLREYFTAKNEEIKNRKLEDNLFERDEVVKILSFAMNMIRNSLINLPNNYAVNLDGLSQKEVKDYVAEDINKILEDLQSVGAQFDN